MVQAGFKNRDHAPLTAAAEKGAVIPLYIVEPSLVTAPDFDQLHYTFIQESIESLSEDLINLGAPLIVRVGEAVDVFQQLYDRIHFTTIWSHIETGNHLTYERDRAVASWALTVVSDGPRCVIKESFAGCWTEIAGKNSGKLL